MTAQPALTYARPVELLLVEDNDGDVLLTRETLRGARITNTLSVAADGEEALSRLKGWAPFEGHARPDVVLLDLNLPRMDGRELLKTLRADPELRSIPVIVLTGSDSDVEMLAVRRLSADGYIVKPIDFERLTRALSAIPAFGFTLVVLPPKPKSRARG
jgi:CheY-like chemotaxis protein